MMSRTHLNAELGRAWRVLVRLPRSPVLVAMSMSLGAYTGRADVLRVPAQYESIGHAALVASSGDTISVSGGLQSLAGSLGQVDVEISSGVVLCAQEGASPEIFLGSNDDGLILAEDGPDTTIVEGLIFNYWDPPSAIDVVTPAAIVRGNIFAGGGGNVIRLRRGGVVDGNEFMTSALCGVLVESGNTSVRFNTFNQQCYYASFFAIEVIPLPADSTEARVEIRNNTFDGAVVSVDGASPPPEVSAFNNIFLRSTLHAGSSGDRYSVIHLDYNLFRWMKWIIWAEVELTLGDANLDWDQDPPEVPVLFCYQSDHGSACDPTIDGASEAASAGDDGGPLGAHPIGCSVTPLGSDDGVGGSPSIAARVGTPRPNPTQGQVRIPVVVEHDTTFEIYDVTGRVVTSLRARRGDTALVWDGRDRERREVPSGTYYVGDRRGTRRLIRVVR